MDDGGDLGEVVRELQCIHQRNGLSSMVAVGALILDRFFGGSVEAWETPSSHRVYSLRRLAQHEGCPYSKSALHQAVRVYMVYKEDAAVQTYGHVGPSHVVAALALSRSDRAEMLAATERERWTVRRLRAEISSRFSERWHERAPAIQNMQALAIILDCERQLREMCEGEGLCNVASDQRHQLEAGLRRVVRTCEFGIAELRREGRQPRGMATERPAECLGDPNVVRYREEPEREAHELLRAM